MQTPRKTLSTTTIRAQPGAFGGRSVLAVGAALALSLTAMRLAGLQYAVPFGLIYIIVVTFPFCFAVTSLIRFLENSRMPKRWQLVVAPLTGIATLCMYWPDRGWFLYPAVIVCSWVAARYVAGPHDGTARRMFSAVLMVGAIYVIVWNGNYLALVASRYRLHDASMRALDEAVYSAILGRPITYEGWFPLTRAPWLLAIFERAYLVLFAEIALALMLVTPHTDALRWFVARLVTCYAGGLLLFVLWPVAGPCLVYPASISATFIGPNTRAIMQSSLVEFSSIMSGGQPVTGFGYFVGFPSLHVAMAVLVQFTIQQCSWIGGWVVAPMNVLLIASTFVLGYHYLADVPGGVLLALGVIGLVRRQAASGRSDGAKSPPRADGAESI